MTADTNTGDIFGAITSEDKCRGERRSCVLASLVPPASGSREWWVLLETKDKMQGWWGRGKTPQDAYQAARRMESNG